MDSGLTIGPNTGLADGSVRPDPVPVRQAVSTDLGSSQTVTATTDTSAGRNDAPRQTPSDPTTTSQTVTIDPATQEVIFREIDVRNGQVIGQIPSAARLRAQVYAQAIANGDTPTAAQSRADTEA